MAEFEPDVVLTRQCPIGNYLGIYLNGELLTDCYEARVKWQSFEEPTFGELIVAAMREGKSIPAVMVKKPRLGEFELDGLLVKFVCGQVRVTVEPEGKDAFELFRRIVTES